MHNSSCQPPIPSWGRMLADAQTMVSLAPHVALIPGLTIVAMVLGLNLLGDGLRDALDPERAVTVRGLAERDVTADLATWTISYSASSASLAEAQDKVRRDTRAIEGFFKELGFPEGALQPTGAMSPAIPMKVSPPTLCASGSRCAARISPARRKRSRGSSTWSGAGCFWKRVLGDEPCLHQAQ